MHAAAAAGHAACLRTVLNHLSQEQATVIKASIKIFITLSRSIRTGPFKKKTTGRKSLTNDHRKIDPVYKKASNIKNKIMTPRAMQWRGFIISQLHLRVYTLPPDTLCTRDGEQVCSHTDTSATDGCQGSAIFVPGPRSGFPR